MPDRLQRVLAALGAVLTLPLLAGLALLIRLDSPGPPFYIAARVGEGGRSFRLVKLRTMRVNAAADGPGISLAEDVRVTRVGKLLRRTRLDELPQLWNVVCGEMRLVGPRPEDPRYVDQTDVLHRLVFTARPGITGLAQLLHTDEATRLDATDPEGSYRSAVLPAKMALDAAYLARRSAGLDAWILFQTALAVSGRPPSPGAVAARLGGAWHPPVVWPERGEGDADPND